MMHSATTMKTDYPAPDSGMTNVSYGTYGTLGFAFMGLVLDHLQQMEEPSKFVEDFIKELETDIDAGTEISLAELIDRLDKMVDSGEDNEHVLGALKELKDIHQNQEPHNKTIIEALAEQFPQIKGKRESRSRISLSTFQLGSIKESAVAGEYETIVLRGGVSLNKRYYPLRLLQSVGKVFEGVPVHAYCSASTGYCDHLPGQVQSESVTRDFQIGTLTEVKSIGRNLVARLKVKKDSVREALDGALKAGVQPGLSIDVIAYATPYPFGKKVVEWVKDIIEALGVDIVTHPAAGGKIVAQYKLESAENQTESVKDLETRWGEMWEAMLREKAVTGLEPQQLVQTQALMREPFSSPKIDLNGNMPNTEVKEPCGCGKKATEATKMLEAMKRMLELESLLKKEELESYITNRLKESSLPLLSREHLREELLLLDETEAVDARVKREEKFVNDLLGSTPGSIPSFIEKRNGTEFKEETLLDVLIGED